MSLEFRMPMDFFPDIFKVDSRFEVHDNFNLNNTEDLSEDLQNHVEMLESMSPEERVSVIRDIEFHIMAFENNIICIQNLKEKKKKMFECSRTLDSLHKTIEIKEKAIDDFYKEMKENLVKEKLTYCEYDNLKRETHIQAKKNAMEFDSLLSITLSQLKTFNKYKNELHEENLSQEKIANLVKKAKKYLQEAKAIEAKNIEKMNRKQKTKGLNKQMENAKNEDETQSEKNDLDTTTELSTKPTDVNNKKIEQEKKTAKKNLRKNKFKINNTQKFKLRKVVTKKEVDKKPKKNVKKSSKTRNSPSSKKGKKSKESKKKSNAQSKTTYKDNEPSKMAESQIVTAENVDDKRHVPKEQDPPADVGCCGSKKSKPSYEIQPPPKRINKNEEGGLLDNKPNMTINDERKRKPNEFDKSTETKSKKSRPNSPKSRLNTPKSRSNTPKSRSNTPKSRSSTPKSKLNTPKSRPNTPKSRPITGMSTSKAENKKVETKSTRSKTPMSPSSTKKTDSKSKERKPRSRTVPLKTLKNKNVEKPKMIKDNEASAKKVEPLEREEDNKENVNLIKEKEDDDLPKSRELRDVIVKDLAASDDDMFLSDKEKKSKKKYLSESDIKSKRKSNQSKFESHFPKDDVRKPTQVEDVTIDQKSDVKENREDLKNQRIEKMKMNERDRLILKNRDLAKQQQEEKERLQRKKQQQDWEDHKIYIKELENNKKKADKDQKAETQKKPIEKQKAISYDYQKLIAESKNRPQQQKNPNIYNGRRDLFEERFSENPIDEENFVEDIASDVQIHSDLEKNVIEEDKKSDKKINIEEKVESEEKVPDTNQIVEEKEEEVNKEEIITKFLDGIDKDAEVVKEVDNKEEIIKETKKEELEIVDLKEATDHTKGMVTETDTVKDDSKLRIHFEKQDKPTNVGCCGRISKTDNKISKENKLEDEGALGMESANVRTQDTLSEERSEHLEMTADITNEIQPQITYSAPPQIDADDDDVEPIVPENEVNNTKFWNKNIYYVEPKSLFERKIACIIRAKPGSIPRRKYLNCDLVLSSEELPYLDQRENYSSYIFKIYPKDIEALSQLSYDTPWQVAIPYYLPESSKKLPLIMYMNEDQNKWIECLTYDVIFDNINNNTLKFVETKMQRPFGTYAVVTFLNKDRTIINRDGAQLTSTSDRNISLSVPPDAVRITINTSLQVTSLDKIFWKEIREKYDKSAIDGICTSSPVIEIEAKKKKFTKPATLTLTLPTDTPAVEERFIKRKVTTDTDFENSKIEDEKSVREKKVLNPFQKTLLMPNINSAKNIDDVHFLSYINEEDRWNIIENPKFNYDKIKELMHVELPSIQTSKFILLKSKRKTNDESISKAAKLINKELCVRNCVIALLQSTKSCTDFALTVSLKKYFQNHLNHLQEEDYVIDPANKLRHVELKERQILTMEFVGNIKCMLPENNEKEFAFHSLFPNTQKFRVREIDAFSQKAVSSFRGYLDLYTKSLVKKPIQSTEGKMRKAQTHYSLVEENTLICHLLLSIKKGRIPKVHPFYNFKFRFKRYHRCIEIIKKVSSKIGVDWWDLGLNLNVTETRMQSIKLHNQEKGLNKMAEQMLLFWLKGCETNENKHNLLIAALKTCGRSDILDRFQKPQDRYLVFGC